MDNLIECPYNKAVVCDEMKCKKCGWNPRVEQIRKVAMRNRISNEPPIAREKWLIGKGSFTK